MFNIAKINTDLKKLFNNNDQNIKLRMFKEIRNKIHLLSPADIISLLEILDVTNNTDLEAKVFSLLGFCFTTKPEFYETIVTHAPLYDHLELCLSKGLPLKTTRVLNFITALVCSDHENNDVFRRSDLAAHARNMVRVSGCLRDMTMLITDTMMFPDTWKALCQCLSECCRDSQLNKMQCTLLIPLCIEKCRQGFMEVLPILQSITKDYPKNVESFIAFGGVAIFNKEVLLNTEALQFLATLVQNNEQIRALLTQSKTPQYVMEILKWNGPHTVKGQWCTIILYYLETFAKSKQKVNVQEQDEVSNSSLDKKQLDTEKNQINDKIRTQKECSNDTNNLFQNIAKEVLYWKAKDKVPSNNKVNYLSKTTSNRLCDEKLNNFLLSRDMKSNDELQDEYSFSFLQNRASHVENNRPLTDISNNIFSKSTSEKGIQTRNTLSTEVMESADMFNEKSSVCSASFKPIVVSTPKKKHVASKRPNKNEIIQKDKASSYSENRNVITKRQKRVSKHVKKSLPVKKLERRSMSARFMNVINESCTALMKTVKDVFLPNSSQKDLENKQRKECDYSFMEYMRKRDMILGEKTIDTTPRTQLNSCQTCDDTTILRGKFSNNEYLRKTTKKLKLGINLFGCDFKKIAKTFWPHDQHITPTVLYDLYRKLILK